MKLIKTLAINFFLIISLLTVSHAVEFTGLVHHNNTPLKNTIVVSIDDRNRIKFAFTDQQGKFSLKARNSEYFIVSVIPLGEGVKQGFTYYKYMQQNRMVFPMNRNKISLNYNLEKTGNLVLVAYDKEGRLLRKENFMNQGHFGDLYMYATDLNGEATSSLPAVVHDEIGRNKDNPEELGIPTMLVPLSKPVSVHTLFWDVKDAGKLWLDMNPDGKGYQFASTGELKTVLVNHALAVTQFRKLRQRFAEMGDTSINDIFRNDIQQIENILKQAGKAFSQKEKARISDDALSRIVLMREEAELLKAEKDIEINRKGNINITLKKADGSPLTGATVSYKQASHDFLFGVSEIGQHPEVARKCKEIGINHTLFMPIMGAIQAERRNWHFNAVDDHFNVDLLFTQNMQVKAHGMMFFFDDFIPKFYRERPFNEVRDNLEKHIKKVIQHYGDNVHIWEAVNEPSSTNPLNFSHDEMLDLIKLSSRVIKQNAPGKKILVNDAGEFDFGLKYIIYDESGKLLNDYITSWDNFLQRLSQRTDINYDIIGLQFYPGFSLGSQFSNARGPAMDLGWFSDYIDQYAKYGKEIHVTEFSVPSTKGDGINGWWRKPWDPEIQAQYLKAIYKIAFSKPLVKSITWWNATDNDSFVVSGGIMDKRRREKPAFNTLKNLLEQWRTIGTKTTDNKGNLQVKGYGGTYNATITTGGSSKQITFLIKEQTNNRISVTVQ